MPIFDQINSPDIICFRLHKNGFHISIDSKVIYLYSTFTILKGPQRMDSHTFRIKSANKNTQVKGGVKIPF